MPKYTAEDVEMAASDLARFGLGNRARMLKAVAADLRAKAAEAARDIVNEPMPGDMLIISPTNTKVFIGQAGPVFDEFAWKAQCDMNPRAGVVRRNEAQR